MRQEPNPEDFRKTARSKRQSWRGAKRHVKALLALRIPNALMRAALRLRPQLNRSGRLPAPRHVTEVLGNVDEASFTMLRPDLCIIAKELYWGRGKRPVSADQYAVTSFTRLARGVDVVVDIGAYTGLFTLASAQANEKVHCHAFELMPDVFRLLFDNCVRNDILERVTLHAQAVGETGGVRVPVGIRASALPDFYSTRLLFNTGVRVRVAPLDELLPALQDAKRVLIKIDVEGTEAEVLASGTQLLERFRPDILCEVLPSPAPAEDLEALLRRTHNFYLVRDSDVVRRDRIVSPTGYRDWWFSPKEPADLERNGIIVSDG